MEIDRWDFILGERVGIDCFYDSISCSLEYMGQLAWALEYVHFRFLYNKDSLITFNDACNLEKALSPNDEYYFEKEEKVGSKYKRDYANEVRREYNENIGRMFNEDSVTVEEILNCNMCKEFSYPISVEINPFAIAKYYKDNNCDVPRTNCRHLVNLFWYDKDKDLWYMVDRGFNCPGKYVDKFTLYEGATDEFIEMNGKINIIYPKEPDKLRIDQRHIAELLSKNIFKSKCEVVKIDDTNYIAAEKGITSFENDIPYILSELEQLHSGFEAPLLGEALIQVIDEARGLYSLFKSTNEILKLDTINEILPLLLDYRREWLRFENILRISTYRNEPVKKYIDDLRKIAKELVATSMKIHNGLEKIYTILWL